MLNGFFVEKMDLLFVVLYCFLFRIYWLLRKVQEIRRIFWLWDLLWICSGSFCILLCATYGMT